MLRIVPLGDSHTRSNVSLREGTTGCRPRLTLLQLELLNTGLIGGDGGTLDTDTVLLDSLSGVNGDLVIGLVTVLKTLDNWLAGPNLIRVGELRSLPSRST